LDIYGISWRSVKGEKMENIIRDGFVIQMEDGCEKHYPPQLCCTECIKKRDQLEKDTQSGKYS